MANPQCLLTYLTFRGLCIVIYSYNRSQQDAPFLNFILVNNSTCFGNSYSSIPTSLADCRHQ